MYDHCATTIANVLHFSKKPVPPELHFKINVDNASQYNAKTIGDTIFFKLIEKLKVDPDNPIYTNKYEYSYDLRCFHISVGLLLFYYYIITILLLFYYYFSLHKNYSTSSYVTRIFQHIKEHINLVIVPDTINKILSKI